MSKFPFLILGFVFLVLGVIPHLGFLIVVSLSLFTAHYFTVRGHRQHKRYHLPKWYRGYGYEQDYRPRIGAPGERHSRSIPDSVKFAVWARDRGRCVVCGTTEKLEFDHRIPWSQGGTNTVNNIQLMCQYHNRSKGARTQGWVF